LSVVVASALLAEQQQQIPVEGVENFACSGGS